MCKDCVWQAWKSPHATDLVFKPNHWESKRNGGIVVCLGGGRQLPASWWAVSRPQTPAPEVVTREARAKEDGLSLLWLSRWRLFLQKWLFLSIRWSPFWYFHKHPRLVFMKKERVDFLLGKTQVGRFWFMSHWLCRFESVVRDHILVKGNFRTQLLPYAQESRKGRA